MILPKSQNSRPYRAVQMDLTLHLMEGAAPVDQDRKAQGLLQREVEQIEPKGL